MNEIYCKQPAVDWAPVKQHKISFLIESQTSASEDLQEWKVISVK